MERRKSYSSSSGEERKQGTFSTRGKRRAPCHSHKDAPSRSCDIYADKTPLPSCHIFFSVSQTCRRTIPKRPRFQFLVVNTSHLPIALLSLLLSCKWGPSELGTQGRCDSLHAPGASILWRGTDTNRLMISVSGWKDMYLLHNMWARKGSLKLLRITGQWLLIGSADCRVSLDGQRLPIHTRAMPLRRTGVEPEAFRRCS